MFTRPLLEYDCAAAGRGHLGAQVLQAKLLPGADGVGGARRVGQPAVVHPGLKAPVLVLPLPVLPLGLLQLPAELQHQRVGDHVGRVTFGAPVVRLVPGEPGGHGFVAPSQLPEEGEVISESEAVDVHMDWFESGFLFCKAEKYANEIWMIDLVEVISNI